MEEDQELKHACKLCDKCFPCGRSLGGHMRSHVMNNSSTEKTDEKFHKKKLKSINNGGEPGSEEGVQNGYILRENPKKTCRFAEDRSNEERHQHNLVHNSKMCKECGKSFQSWKALFGHMKCHSDNKEKISNCLEEENSWTNQKLVMDSESDIETAVPNRKKRSRRRRIRYMTTSVTTTTTTTTTTSSSLSLANYASSSASEIEQEQEEVAICLMMLSRDVNHWGGFNSVGESSDNDSVFFEAPPLVQTNQVMIKSTFCDGYLRNGIKMKNIEVPINLESKFEVELGKNMSTQIEDDEAELGLNKKKNSSKKRVVDDDDDDDNDEVMMNSSKKMVIGHGFDSEFCKKKSSSSSSKFECTTCNKIFHSYQALGGHRASHKKIKGCSASKTDESIENSIETSDIKLLKSSSSSCNKLGREIATKKSTKGHECPICFKVFSSGQALGGHKRSHLIYGTSSETKMDHQIQKPVQEVRDFLDLNLPAPIEEDSSNGFKPWWVNGSSTHKHEAFVGLISN